MSITLRFRLGTNLNAAAEETRAAIAKVAYLLPPDANPPTVSKSNPNQQAVLWFAYLDSWLNSRTRRQ